MQTVNHWFLIQKTFSMGFFAKAIFTGLGWALGGPLGAIIGYAIGRAFSAATDSAEQHIPIESGEQQTGTSGSTSYKTSSVNDFRAALLVLIACVMKADGHVKRSELDVVKSFLVRNYGEDDAKVALQMLKHILEQDIDVIAVARQIGQNVNYSVRLEIIHLLLDIAHADGEITHSEEQMIVRIAVCFKLKDNDLISLMSLYRKGKDPDWAYKALEIEPSVTDEEVKRAYRRMAMKYHPDKVASAGEEVKQAATEKFRAINEAYEEIKKQRGMN